jgi:hypothetical protein
LDLRKFVSGINELCASLKGISARHENHQRTTLIVLKGIFYEMENQSGDQNPLKKRGTIRKAKLVGIFKIYKQNNVTWKKYQFLA